MKLSPGRAVVAQCSGILDEVGSKDMESIWGMETRAWERHFLSLCGHIQRAFRNATVLSLSPPNLGELDSCVHSSRKKSWKSHGRESEALGLKSASQSLGFLI